MLSPSPGSRLNSRATTDFSDRLIRYIYYIYLLMSIIINLMIVKRKDEQNDRIYETLLLS